jgi:hypothetical protein
MYLHEKIYYYMLTLSYITYFIVIFNLSNNYPSYLPVLNNMLKLYVIGFLIIRFNPIVNTKFTNFDKQIVFSSAIFLLLTTSFTTYLTKVINIKQI